MSEEEAVERVEKYIKNFEGNSLDCIAIGTLLQSIEKDKAEIEKKDKMIDKMAEIIGEYIHEVNAKDEICKHQKEEFCKNSRMMNLNLCIYCIKQYFERKVEE